MLHLFNSRTEIFRNMDKRGKRGKREDFTSRAKILVIISFFCRFRSGVVGFEDVEEEMEAIKEEVRLE
jgi:hypothetical protein